LHTVSIEGLRREEQRMSKFGRCVAAGVMALAVSCGAVPPAAADQPLVETYHYQQSWFTQHFLPNNCGVPGIVEERTDFRAKVRLFDFDGTGLAQLDTFLVVYSIIYRDNTYRLRLTGVSNYRYADGTVIATFAGKTPWVHTGVIKYDVNTRRIIFASEHDWTSGDTARVCAALTA
jgi:hypothetical protein